MPKVTLTREEREFIVGTTDAEDVVHVFTDSETAQGRRLVADARKASLTVTPCGAGVEFDVPRRMLRVRIGRPSEARQAAARERVRHLHASRQNSNRAQEPNLAQNPLLHTSELGLGSGGC